MSELKTNKISTNDQNNVAIDNALQIKGYTAAERDALTASAGDMIYNEDDGTIDFYNGTAWFSTSGSTFPFAVSYLVIAGGGGGPPSFGGGGGAGGYRNSYASETSGRNSSTETPLSITKGTNVTVTVGAGGVGYLSGNDSVFSTITSAGGGRGGQYSSQGTLGGSGGGGSGHGSTDAIGGQGT